MNKQTAPEPEPPTPEERYDDAMDRFVLAEEAWGNAPPGYREHVALLDICGSLRIQSAALRDMIASRDRELDSILRAVTALDNRVGALESRPTMTWKGIRQGVPLPDPDEEPETVTVPRKLMNELDTWMHSPGTNWMRLKAQYDAWKAAQR